MLFQIDISFQIQLKKKIYRNKETAALEQSVNYRMKVCVYMIYMNSNSSRARDSSEIVSSLISNLAELTKSYQRLTTKHVALSSRLEACGCFNIQKQANNKEMNQILKVMHEAIPKLKSTYGNTSRSSETFTNMLDRMVGQLRQEYAKLQENLKEIQGKQAFQDEKGGENLNYEANVLIEQIQNAVHSSLKKLEEQIKKQRKSLGQQPENSDPNPYKISILRSAVLQKSKVHQNIQQCKTILGEIRCFVDLKQPDTNQQNNMTQQQQQIKVREKIENFIKGCNLHFDRQVKIVVEKLGLFRNSGKISKYEQKIWNSFNTMGNRLKIRLQSAIIKLAYSIQQSQQTEKDKQILKGWKEVLAGWEQTLHMIKQVIL